jgi:hypothetical protein
MNLPKHPHSMGLFNDMIPKTVEMRKNRQEKTAAYKSWKDVINIAPTSNSNTARKIVNAYINGGLLGKK